MARSVAIWGGHTKPDSKNTQLSHIHTWEGQSHTQSLVMLYDRLVGALPQQVRKTILAGTWPRTRETQHGNGPSNHPTPRHTTREERCVDLVRRGAIEFHLSS